MVAAVHRGMRSEKLTSSMMVTISLGAGRPTVKDCFIGDGDLALIPVDGRLVMEFYGEAAPHRMRQKQRKQNHIIKRGDLS